VNALDVLAEEGRARPRKASGSCQEAMIRRCPNGETPLLVIIESPLAGGEPGELKYLSTRRKRNHLRCR